MKGIGLIVINIYPQLFQSMSSLLQLVLLLHQNWIWKVASTHPKPLAIPPKGSDLHLFQSSKTIVAQIDAAFLVVIFQLVQMNGA